MDSVDFKLVLKALLDSLYNQLSQSLDSVFLPIPRLNTSQVAVQLPQRQVKLVKLLPRASNEAHVLLNSNPNGYIDVSLLLDQWSPPARRPRC